MMMRNRRLAAGTTWAILLVGAILLSPSMQKAMSRPAAQGSASDFYFAVTADQR
jgi:hypothetical protein